jgi:tryptophanyl-tRNA synthetase
LAFGFDVEKNFLYRQSRIPEVCELTWYLNCLTPFPMLANAHSFKDKSEKLADVNAGLFTYPVLMTADIILYDAQYVPVGKDQRQHVEIARDIASAFNNQYGETFVVPEAKIEEQVMQVLSIVTDSTPLEAPKNPDKDNVFAIYSLIAPPEETDLLRRKYLAGNYGYGHAKQELFELIVKRYAKEREAFTYYMSNPEALDKKLEQGEAKARVIAQEILGRVRVKLGFR